MRTPSGGRPAGGPAHSPAAEGTAGDLGVERRSSQAALVGEAVKAGARVAKAGTGVVMAAAARAAAAARTAAGAKTVRRLPLGGRAFGRLSGFGCSRARVFFVVHVDLVVRSVSWPASQ